MTTACMTTACMTTAPAFPCALLPPPPLAHCNLLPRCILNLPTVESLFRFLCLCPLHPLWDADTAGKDLWVLFVFMKAVHLTWLQHRAATTPQQAGTAGARGCCRQA
eukprot:6198096-Pleurochrysis_carterae.AAC.1